MTAVYQLFLPLRDAEYDALKADIAKRGIMVPAELDQDGNVLDGHHRMKIADELGIECPTVMRTFDTESDKREHVLKMNLLRRHLDALSWAEAFTRLLEVRGVGRGHGANQGKHSATVAECAEELGVPERTARHRLSLLDLPEDEKSKVREGDKSAKQALQQQARIQKEEKREERREENREKVAESPNPAESGAQYATILIDPPWSWDDEGDADQLGRARPTYATLSKDQLLSLPLPDLSDVDCHLYLWITNRSLPKGFDLIERWGFRYVTMLTWPKPSFGLGNYFRGQTEHVLFGVRGSQMLLRKDASTLLPTWGRGKGGHSSKPPEFYDFIESCSPGPYLEMFSRVRRDGWSSWGEDG